jgi:hypothetical protein
VVTAQHIWPGAEDNVVLHNVTPEQAVKTAMQQTQAIFDQYQISSSTASN